MTKTRSRLKISPSQAGTGKETEAGDSQPCAITFPRNGGENSGRRGLVHGAGLFLFPFTSLGPGRIREMEGRRGERIGGGTGELTRADYNFKHCPSLWPFPW